MYNKKKYSKEEKKHVTIFLEMISQGVSILITQFYIFVPTLFFKETLLYSSTLLLRLALSFVFILLYLNIVRVLVVYSTNQTASQPASQPVNQQASQQSIHPSIRRYYSLSFFLFDTHLNAIRSMFLLCTLSSSHRKSRRYKNDKSFSYTSEHKKENE